MTIGIERYDRQLRLWGDYGQRRLHAVHVLVLGSNTVATEALKNLVLPGIGFFTILDDTVVTSTHIFQDLFLEELDIGRQRCECVVEKLTELNSEVENQFVIKNPNEFIKFPDIQFLSNYEVVVISDSSITLQSLCDFCDLCGQLDKILIFAQSRSLFGSIRTYVKEHLIIESKPDHDMWQLWIPNPFLELKSYCATINLEAISDHEFTQLPFIIFLMKGVQHFFETLPKVLQNQRTPAMKDLESIKTWLKAQQRSVNCTNIEEAFSYLHHCVVRADLPDTLQDIFSQSDDKCYSLIQMYLQSEKKSDSQFFLKQHIACWITARSIYEFYKKENRLVCIGTLPDITSSSENYLKLKRLSYCMSRYTEQHRRDVDFVIQEITMYLKQFKLTIEDLAFDNQFVARFCQHVLECKIIKYRTLKQTFEDVLPQDTIETIEEWEQETDKETFPIHSAYNWYLLQLGLDAVEEERSNISAIKEKITAFLSKWGITKYKQIHDHFYDSILLVENLPIHSTAAFVGAIAAQEIIKFITCQYEPLNNTFLWNGFSGHGMSLEM